MSLASRLETLENQVIKLRDELALAQASLNPIQNSRTRPPAPLQVGRLNRTDVITSAAHQHGGLIQRIAVTPATTVINEDSGFAFEHVNSLTRDGEIQPELSFDFAIMKIGHFRFIVPQPHRLIPVVCDEITGGAFGHGTGSFGTLSGSTLGATPAPGITPGADVLSMYSVNPLLAFHASTLPLKAGHAYVGHRAWPQIDFTVDPAVSLLVDVDTEKGFFVIYPMPPGDKAETFAPATISVAAAEAFTLGIEGDVDGQGNLLALRLIKT